MVSADKPDTRPNIILINCDDLGALRQPGLRAQREAQKAKEKEGPTT